MHLDLVAVVVEEYDHAIEFFVGVLGFELVEDSPSLTNDGRPKRWVVVRPPHSQTGLLLARADGPSQVEVVGQQVAERVGFFRDVVEHYVREHNVPEMDVAAALAVALQGDEPLLLDPAHDQMRTPPPSKDRGQRDDRSSSRPDRGPRKERPSRAGEAPRRREAQPRFSGSTGSSARASMSCRWTAAPSIARPRTRRRKRSSGSQARTSSDGRLRPRAPPVSV